MATIVNIAFGFGLLLFVFILFMISVIVTLEAWHKWKGESY